MSEFLETTRDPVLDIEALAKALTTAWWGDLAEWDDLPEDVRLTWITKALRVEDAYYRLTTEPESPGVPGDGSDVWGSA